MADHYEFARPEKWAFNELPSLAGKVAIVTGANSRGGIGYHIAHQLALSGARVYVGARNQQKAADAIKAMLEDSPSLDAASLKPLVADMGNFPDVQRAAREFIAAEDRLDILVNNAAVLAGPVTLDAHGLSISFGINYLGPFLFTTELMPLLAVTAGRDPASDVRVVNVGSTAHFDVPAGVRFGSLDDFNNHFGSQEDPTGHYHHYGYTKLASLLFSKELQRRFDARGDRVLVLAPHPGPIRSDGAVRYIGSMDSELFAKSLSPFDGALAPLFAAAHPEPAKDRAKYAGAFLLPYGGWKQASEQARDPKLAAQLWEASEALLKTILN
ncbi:short-chain dehydrogenase [Xylariaceae sp. AK1471]|nr:short-chain dehydrogenase [Xylariaceae sp. AK1471]